MISSATIASTKTAAAAEGPWSDPCANALQGLSQTLVLPEFRKPIRRKGSISRPRL